MYAPPHPHHILSSLCISGTVLLDLFSACYSSLEGEVASFCACFFLQHVIDHDTLVAILSLLYGHLALTIWNGM